MKQVKRAIKAVKPAKKQASPVNKPVVCNYSNNYYGDQVCRIQ